MTQIYMILSSVGAERGAPIGLYFDPFKATDDFNAINNMSTYWSGDPTAFLVAYELSAEGLVEIAELGRK